MKLKQYTGPFTNNQTISAATDGVSYTFVQIGIQVPQVEFYVPLLLINNVPYEISSGNDIIEFSNFKESSLEIRFLRDLPSETIIDIGFYK